MVKNGDLNTIYSSKELLNLLASSEDFVSNITHVLDSLLKEINAEYAFVLDLARTRIINSSSALGVSIHLDSLPSGLRKIELLNSWQLYIKEGTNSIEIEENIAIYVAFLNIIIKENRVTERLNLIVSLASDLRKTMKPNVALSKIYDGLQEFLQIKEFFFFEKRSSTDDPTKQVFELFYPRQTEYDFPKILKLDELNSLDLGNLHKLRFEARSKDKFWGVLLIAREEAWEPVDIELIKPFSEQLSLVYDQHEMHSESLSMAQREFLLNQVTTTIRESMDVDEIIRVASQEIAQVMGVEACGILLLDRKLKSRSHHYVWSPEEVNIKRLGSVLKRSINSEYAPDLDHGIVNVSDFKSHTDSLANFFSELLGVKSYLACALYKKDTIADTAGVHSSLLGIVAVACFNHYRTWTGDEEQLLESIASQVEMALTQAAVYQESQQTKMQMALLHKLSGDIRDSLEISKVLERIANGLGDVLGLSRCFVRMISTNDNDVKISKTEKEFVAEGFSLSADVIFGFEKEWILELANKDLSKKETLEYLNIPYVKAKLMAEDSPLMHIAEAIDLKSMLCVPLISRRRILGTINVHQCDRERNFLEEEIEFICRVASEAVVAIEHAELFDTIGKMSRTDPDTGLYNKRFFKELALEELERAKEDKQPISFIMLDLDHLKEINDTPGVGGHDAGDEAILLTAQALEKTVRQAPTDEVRTRGADLVARFGGDEFMILLPNTTMNSAIKVVERIIQNLNKAEHSTWDKPLSLSVGIAEASKDSYDYETLKMQADKALYFSKDKGRAVFSTTLEL